MKQESAGLDMPADIVRRARSGDAAALEAVLRGLYPLVSRWALVKTGAVDDAEDVTQEVMIRVSKYIKRFDDRSKVSTWAYQITSNACTDHHRRSARRVDAGTAAPKPGGEGEPTAKVSPTQSAEGLDERDAVDLVRAFFAQLPRRQREVFDLADLQGYRASEVAEMLGMNPATVRGHLFRARRFIRSKILETNPKLVEAYGREL